MKRTTNKVCHRNAAEALPETAHYGVVHHYLEQARLLESRLQFIPTRHTFGRAYVDARKTNPSITRTSPRTPFNWLEPEEAPAVPNVLEKLVGHRRRAAETFFGLTICSRPVRSNTASLTSNLNAVAVSAPPAGAICDVLTRRLTSRRALTATAFNLKSGSPCWTARS